MLDDLSRRNLIGLGVAGAAAALAGEAGAQAGPHPSDGETVGFAVVGLGKLAQGQIIPGLRKTRRAKLTALVSGHPDKAHRIAAQEGLPDSAIYSYEDYDRIAHDPRVQVVYIVLPNSMHAEYTIRALKAGKHVLCEKPMATSIADCEAMIAAARAADRKLMIAYRCHYEPLNLQAMRHMRAGALGAPRIIDTSMGRQADPSDPSDAWRLNAAMSGGGALADMGIYGVSAARYLTNEEPVEVRAWSHTDPNDPRFRQTPETIDWQFRFPSGAINAGSTSFAYEATMSYQVFGDSGRLVADPGCLYGGNRFSILHRGRSEPFTNPEADQFAREMEWMANIALGRAPVVSPGEEGLQDMRLMKAIMESAANNGRTIPVDWSYRRAYDPAVVVPLGPIA